MPRLAQELQKQSGQQSKGETGKSLREMSVLYEEIGEILEGCESYLDLVKRVMADKKN
ncbi:hypothetical protein K0B03_02475 [Patescibacteria group bacterium]|nr:hypothetical protein [Patescibacteria group bacterium]